MESSNPAAGRHRALADRVDRLPNGVLADRETSVNGSADVVDGGQTYQSDDASLGASPDGDRA